MRPSLEAKPARQHHLRLLVGGKDFGKCEFRIQGLFFVCSCILPYLGKLGLNCVKDLLASPHVLKQARGPQDIQYLIFILSLVLLVNQRLHRFLYWLRFAFGFLKGETPFAWFGCGQAWLWWGLGFGRRRGRYHWRRISCCVCCGGGVGKPLSGEKDSCQGAIDVPLGDCCGLFAVFGARRSGALRSGSGSRSPSSGCLYAATPPLNSHVKTNHIWFCHSRHPSDLPVGQLVGACHFY